MAPGVRRPPRQGQLGALGTGAVDPAGRLGGTGSGAEMGAGRTAAGGPAGASAPGGARGVPYRVGVGILRGSPAWMPCVFTDGFQAYTVASGTPNQCAMLNRLSPLRTV